MFQLEFQNNYWRRNSIMFSRLCKVVLSSKHFSMTSISHSKANRDLLQWILEETIWMDPSYQTKKSIVLRIHFILTGTKNPPICMNEKCENYLKVMENIHVILNDGEKLINNSPWHTTTHCSQECQRTSKDVSQKRKENCLLRNGCTCSSKVSSTRKKISNTLKRRWKEAEFVQQKRNTCLEHFGVEHQFQSPTVQEKCKRKLLERYHEENFSKTDEFRDLMTDPEFNEKRMNKQFETKKRNGTLNTSKDEDLGLFLLREAFGEDNVEHSYKSEEYPFHCDYYVRSLELYIELNEHWTHGNHLFDSASEEDLQILEKWKQKRSKYYDNAIYVWTELDPKKVSTAKENNLNYVIFWSLKEMRNWLNERKVNFLTSK